MSVGGELTKLGFIRTGLIATLACRREIARAAGLPLRDITLVTRARPVRQRARFVVAESEHLPVKLDRLRREDIISRHAQPI
eukprot:SAG31_NODE_2582_length_5436_cov_1.573356_4_plen_82_part_00